MKKLLLVALMVMPLSLFAQKFGHFDSSAIVQQLPEFKTAQTEIQKMTQQFEADLKTMQEELQRKYETYQTQRDSMPDNMRARKEKELSDLDQRIQQTYTENQQTLSQKSQEAQQAIAEKIQAAVKSIGEAGGYVYIMDTTSGIPFINTTLSKDITDELKKKLGI